MAVLTGLKPEKVFYYFERICSVPHGSGNTEQISNLCVEFAKELNLAYRKDEVGNVVVWKNATAGYEKAEPIILQGHIDMVCTKTADCTIDMAKEGLKLVTDGENVWADKTTLGGDNGIAVAMIFALFADENLTHPPLEAVLTVDEEVGMDGAIFLDCSDIKGRKLINLDSEEEGAFTVSCAGGVRADCVLKGEKAPLTNEICYKLEISGLLGGHSGGDIHLGRASANKLMARVLFSAMKKIGGIRLCDIYGGQFDNVICNHSTAVVAVPKEKASDFEAFISNIAKLIKNEFATTDKGISIALEKTSPMEAVGEKDTYTMLYTLFAIPQGVQAVNHDFEGLTQTSINLGVVKMQEGDLYFTYSIRSCIASQKEALLSKVTAIVEFSGGTVTTRSAYPGWQFERESKFRDLILEVYKEQTGKDGRLEATHGGLECGLLIEKMPGLDVVSMGPELHDVHSVNEILNVPSTERVYNLVREILIRSK